jgi:hypothetical protein
MPDNANPFSGRGRPVDLLACTTLTPGPVQGSGWSCRSRFATVEDDA